MTIQLCNRILASIANLWAPNYILSTVAILLCAAVVAVLGAIALMYAPSSQRSGSGYQRVANDETHFVDDVNDFTISFDDDYSDEENGSLEPSAVIAHSVHGNGNESLVPSSTGSVDPHSRLGDSTHRTSDDAVVTHFSAKIAQAFVSHHIGASVLSRIEPKSHVEESEF